MQLAKTVFKGINQKIAVKYVPTLPTFKNCFF